MLYFSKKMFFCSSFMRKLYKGASVSHFQNVAVTVVRVGGAFQCFPDPVKLLCCSNDAKFK